MSIKKYSRPKKADPKQYLDPRWQKIRLEILSRDDWKCRICGSSEKTFHVHHTYYSDDADGPWDYPPHTLLSLCDACHTSEHEVFYSVRNDLAESLILAGFTTTAQLGGVADAFYAVPDLSDSERQQFMNAIRLALDSRYKKEAGWTGADDAWQELIAISESRR